MIVQYECRKWQSRMYMPTIHLLLKQVAAERHPDHFFLSTHHMPHPIQEMGGNQGYEVAEFSFCLSSLDNSWMDKQLNRQTVE